MATLEDEVTQKMGGVNVVSLLGPRGLIDDFGRLRDASALKDMLPDRSGCIHVCTDSSIVFPMLQIVAFLAPTDVRARIRHHYFGK